MKNNWHLFTALALLSITEVQAQQTHTVMALEEIFQYADRNSKSQKAHSLSISAAKESIKSAKDGKLPQLDAGLSFSYLGNGWVFDRDFGNSMKAGIPHYGNNFVLTASQIIYSGGAVTTGIKMAELAGKIAEQEKAIDRNNLRFMLAGYYVEMYKLDNQIRVYDRNIALTSELIESAQARYQEGTGLENDITRYELQLDNYKMAKTRTQNTRNILNYKMNKLAGIEQQTVVVPDSNTLSDIPEESTGDIWHHTATASAPSISLAKLGIEQAQQQERMIRSERMPKVALIAEEHLDGPVTIEIPALNKNFNYWFIGIGATFNISSLYKNKSKKNMAHMQTLRRKEELELLKDNIANAVEEDYTHYKEAILEIGTLKKNMQLAEQNYETMHTRYANGLALATEMLEVSNTLIDAGLKLANAYANVQFAYYKLKYTSGTL